MIGLYYGGPHAYAPVYPPGYAPVYPPGYAPVYPPGYAPVYPPGYAPVYPPGYAPVYPPRLQACTYPRFQANAPPRFQAGAFSYFFHRLSHFRRMTPKTASPKMLLFILDVPSSRLMKMTGTSLMRKPYL